MMMYDIHMHIIPRVDDGSRSMNMSEQLLYMAYEQKIKKIIATPHSSAFLGGDKMVKENFGQLQDMGCLFQINVYSVYDESNEKIKANARQLIDEKRVAFLGSDAHRTTHRPPGVRYGLKYLYENYEKDYIDRIAYKNAEELLNMRE